MSKKSKISNTNQNLNTQNLTKLNQVKTSNFYSSQDDKKKYFVDIPKKFKAINNRYLLIGAPNVGKSTFFNKASYSVANVSNIDRLTVSSNWGLIKGHKDAVLVDLPGVYNLSHPIDEEIVVADAILRTDYKNITNIIGAQSIERDLYLSLQVAETGMLSTIIINMIDEINVRTLNISKISKAFKGINVITCSASKSKNVNKAIKTIIKTNKKASPKILTYSNEIEKYITKLSNLVPNGKLSKRFVSLMLLEGNKYIIDYLKYLNNHNLNEILQVLEEVKNKNFGEQIKNERVKFIENLLKVSINETPKLKFIKKDKEKQHKIDHILLNKWIGIPLAILLLIVIYYVTFGPYMGGSLQDLLGNKFLNDIVADQWLNSLFNDVFKSATWFNELMINGVFKGLFAVISFIPPIVILFFLINLINQVGIVSRLSVLLDETFAHFGLSGRSILNLMTGFGCNVPAVMLARSSNSKKERFISLLVTPFVSCSARAIVYSFICEAMFSIAFGWIGMIGLTLFSGIFALLIGLVFSKTLFRKQKSFFFVEMVDWRKPDIIVILKNVWLEFINFIKKAATIIILANLIIWLLTHLGPTGLLTGDENIDTSFIGYAGKYLNYLMYPMGGNLSKGWVGSNEGWKMTVSLISAFPAKEIAVSNINVLFANTFNTFISKNIPIGMSYLVILMIYLPCLATFRIVVKEGGWKILFTHIGISLSSAYILGIITYWLTYAILLI